HHEVARMVLDALGVPNALEPMAPATARPARWREARVRDMVWAREHLVPWVVRRIRHQSSGDNISAKRPFAEPLFQPHELAEHLGVPPERVGAAEVVSSPEQIADPERGDAPPQTPQPSSSSGE
ncbi:MAG: hypothetical protein ACTH31_14700, partial [Pseudoclavibacter sp.]